MLLMPRCFMEISLLFLQLQQYMEVSFQEAMAAQG